MASIGRDETLRWHEPAWLADVTAWIDERVDRTGDVEQPHAYPWATALRVPTTDGVVWFKACIPELAHEVATLELLASRRPDLVTRVLDSDAARGWMLLAAAGVRLRELHDEPGQVGRWETAVAAYAQLQLEAAPDAERFVAAGVPDRRGARLVEQLERLLADDAALAPANDEALAPDEIERVRALVPRVAEDVGELAALGLPASIQHDDLHDGNVFVDDGTFRVIDWGDACVVDPLLSLHVMLGVVAFRWGDDAPAVARVRDAYLEPFTAVRTRAELDAALPVVDRLGLAGGAVKWYEIVGALPEHTRGPFLDAVPYKLRQLLAKCG